MPGGKKVCCFVAGTLVETKDGLQPIETLKTGDLVLAKDVVTGEIAYKKITDLIRRHDRIIWKVVVETEDKQTDVFETTDDHPWWIPAQGWVTTEGLAAGMDATTADGRTITITSVTETTRLDATYNITVADFETYFVGKQRVLVHNCKDAANGVKLQKQLASESQVSSLSEGGGKVISQPAKQADRIAAKTGSNPNNIQKVSSDSFTAKDGQKIQTHSFRDASTNELIEPKTIIDD